MQDKKTVGGTVEEQTFVEGIDFYFDNGFMVLTRSYLLNRGVCCETDCRHCPFGRETAGTASQ